MVNKVASPLVRVKVEGHRFLCMVFAGRTITLCGRIGLYPSHYMPSRPICPDCERTATRAGLTVPT